VLVDEPVFYLSPGAPATSLLFGLAGAVPTFYTGGYHDDFLSVWRAFFSHEECTALLFQKILLSYTYSNLWVADLNFFSCTFVCVHVKQQPVFFCFFFYKVCFLHPCFPNHGPLQPIKRHHSSPQPALHCVQLWHAGLRYALAWLAVWSWSKEVERVRKGEKKKRGKEREGDKLNLMYAVIKCRLLKSTTYPAHSYYFSF